MLSQDVLSERLTKLASLFRDRFVVGVSLPGNDVRLARAAVQGGADFLKIHLNVEHRASGVRFGHWNEERERIEAILAEVEIPVGIMPGASVRDVATDLPALMERGFAFMDAYIEHLPASLVSTTTVPLMPALGAGQGGAEATALSALPGVGCIEASVICPEVYGEPLTLDDVLLYQSITAQSTYPVVIPTQKRITPEDVPALKAAGCGGVLLGAVVFGTDAADITESVRRFKVAAA